MKMTVSASAEVKPGVTADKITWRGPLTMLTARSILAVIYQALVATLFYSGTPNSWNAAGQWWRVYGTIIDIGCIVLLVWLTRREGVRLLDLGKYSSEGWLKDILLGLGFSVPVLLAFAVPTVILEIVLYNGSAPVPGAGLPLMGSLYALIIWPIIWAFAEDNTYFGYSLPRIEALTGRTWMAIIIVSFFTALQHVFLPLRLEWQWFVSHFLGYILGAIVTCMLYQRWRRLLPMHTFHWVINILGVIMVIVSTLGR